MDHSDNGSYVISVSDAAVFDLEGHSVVAGTIGQFDIHIAPTIGPDAFGYLAESTAFEFEDISLTGQAILVRSDDESVQISDALWVIFSFLCTARRIHRCSFHPMA